MKRSQVEAIIRQVIPTLLKAAENVPIFGAIASAASQVIFYFTLQLPHKVIIFTFDFLFSFICGR